MLDRLFAMGISSYQRYISPYKGFRCAHRAAHGGASCSEYTKRAILQLGVRDSLPAIRRRFRRCRLAASRLRAAPGNSAEETGPSSEPDEADEGHEQEGEGEREEKSKLYDWLCVDWCCLPDSGCDAVDCCHCVP